MAVAEVTREGEVVAAAIRGDEDAFSAIYDLLSLRVFNYVLRSVHERSTAEDVCQEIWLKAHREIRTLKSPQALRTWLFRMASRACIDYSRSRACRERGSPEVTEEMLEIASREPEVVALRQGEMRLMWEALAALPPRQSMALYLKQVDGCSYDEIGRILGCPKSAVETLLFRARHGLARTHERFEADPKARCKMVAATMSVVLDKEGTPFQERAVKGHLSECKPCRGELAGMKRGVAGYAWLPMLPVGGQALSMALTGGTVGAGAGFGISRLVGMMLIKGKASGIIALTAGAVATTGVTAAVVGIAPAPFDAFGVVAEVGTAVRDATIGGSDEEGSSSLKVVEDVALPPLAPLQTQPVGSGAQSALPAQAPQTTLPLASQLDPIAALSGLPGLLEGASSGTLATLEPLLTFVGGTLGGVLEDPLAALQQLLSNPGATIDGLANDATQALNETTQNATTTVDDTVNQTTDIVDGLLGENELTGSLDETVDNTTDLVDDTVGGVTGLVDETTGGLGETLDGLLGDDGLVGGDDGLLGGLLGDDGLLGGLGGSPPPEEEPPPPEEEEEPSVVCTLLPILCP
jgi:RNA polymerase sigma-70 factor (ECF subfamily)